MRRYADSRWIDLAPLEVERPRLPWWTLLPRKLLLIASPVIVLAVPADRAAQHQPDI
ncbi:MAG: hypothetical protein ACRDSL_25040 [Pseudonocardiaceae bacterium]